MAQITAFFATVPGAIILLLLGFVFLIKGADYFVEGAGAIAVKFKVPTLIIGMTIVAMGTSLPETAVSITASMEGANSLAISNAVGSNIFNLMVVLGACALITKLPVTKDVLKRDYPFSVLCALVLGVIGFVLFSPMCLGRIDGTILLLLFSLFLFWQISSALKASKEGKKVEVEGEDEIHDMNILLALVYIVGGATAIMFGGNWVVDGACTVARALNMTETLIGLTVVALGTSLPELVTSMVAAKKNQLDMAIGNVVGSNVFNILMVLGIASVISPVVVTMQNIIDIAVLTVFSIIVFIMCFKKGYLSRANGAVMLILYAAYIVYAIIR